MKWNGMEWNEKNICSIALLSSLIFFGSSVIATANTNSVYRLYNKNSGEHFFTIDINEKKILSRIGWQDEGIAWSAPTKGVAVHRVYNKNVGEHHYTTNRKECENLKRLGWLYEGICWYSGGNSPIFRVYNPNARTGSHHFTLNKNENKLLVKLGWYDEGIAWYGYNYTLPETSILPSMFDARALVASQKISNYLAKQYSLVESQYFRWDLVSKNGSDIVFDVYEPFNSMKVKQDLIGRFLVDSQDRLFLITSQAKTLIK
jgi:hypothetical protein